MASALNTMGDLDAALYSQLGQAAQNRSYHVPSPPRFSVPPPLMDEIGTSRFTLTTKTSADFESNGFTNSDFLKTVTFGTFKTTDSIIDWRYEQRREAQEVLPFLFLGPVSAARDEAFLNDQGITMVMAIRNKLSAEAKLLDPKTPRRLGLEVSCVDVLGNSQLIAAFPTAIEEINAHLSARCREQQTTNSKPSRPGKRPSINVPGKVLIFCETGNERSAAVAAAYIMAMYSVQLVEALQVLQTQRFCVSIDDSLRHLLQSYEDILKAKRDVLKINSSTVDENQLTGKGHEEILDSEGYTMPKKQGKRNHDETTDDEDVEMDDWVRFEHREIQAPFANE